MRRIVRIVRDTGSPLWAIVCAKPCLFLGCEVCWLGSSFTQAGAADYARGLGYEIVE